MGLDKFLDYLDDGSWIVLVAAQTFHRAPIGTRAVYDMIDQLAVSGFYPMLLQQRKCRLAHHVGMDLPHVANGHACCSGLAHRFVGDDCAQQYVGTLGYQYQQIFHAALGETVDIAVSTLHHKGQSLIMQDIYQLFHVTKIVQFEKN